MEGGRGHLETEHTEQHTEHLTACFIFPAHGAPKDPSSMRMTQRKCEHRIALLSKNLDINIQWCEFMFGSWGLFFEQNAPKLTHVLVRVVLSGDDSFFENHSLATGGASSKSDDFPKCLLTYYQYNRTTVPRPDLVRLYTRPL